MVLFNRAAWVRGQTVNVLLKFFLTTLPKNVLRSLEVPSTWFMRSDSLPSCTEMVTLFPCNTGNYHWSLAVLIKDVSNIVRFIR